MGPFLIEVEVVQDICDLEVDAVVNAANKGLLAGAGVCGSIHRKGGDTIFQECVALLRSQKRSALEEGDVLATTGGQLKAKYVIHAVGPIWKSDPQDRKSLYKAYYKGVESLSISRLSLKASATANAFSSLSKKQ